MRVRENRVETVVKKKAHVIPESLFFHALEFRRCLWSFGEAFFFKRNSRKIHAKIHAKIHTQIHTQNSSTEVIRNLPTKPPPKRPAMDPKILRHIP